MIKMFLGRGRVANDVIIESVEHYSSSSLLLFRIFASASHRCCCFESGLQPFSSAL